MRKHTFSTMTKLGDRVAMAVSYNGSAYHGWQSQRKVQVPTVQEELEKILSQIADERVVVQCAGRTDSGVHASQQIVHFDSPVDRPERAWVMGSNTKLPSDIAVQWARPVAKEFHARFSATARRYRYIILNTAARTSILSGGVTRIGRKINEASMHLAAQSLVGEMDFTSYRAAACQSKTPMRNVHYITVSRRGDMVIIDIKANAFLHHMVRNIAGVLLEIGTGGKKVSWAAEVLAARDRTVAAATAPPHGLYLVAVSYPDHFGLPDSVPGPFFMAD